MIKKTAMIAGVLLGIGIIGSVFTFASANKMEDFEKEKTIKEDFDAIDIKAGNAKIEVLPTRDKEARVELSGKGSNIDFSANVEQSNLRVVVNDQQKKLIHFDFISSRLALNVYVPEKQYQALTIESDNGLVEASELQAKAIQIRTDNGAIQLQEMKSEKMNIGTSNGKILVKDSEAGAADAKANNGKISFDHVKGALSAEADNGSISLNTESLDRPLDFETDNGKINIKTENKPTNAIFDVKVDNGKVKLFGQSDWDTVIGNGAHMIKLTTNNGNITVEKI